jgi:hypothetical protein
VANVHGDNTTGANGELVGTVSVINTAASNASSRRLSPDDGR